LFLFLTSLSFDLHQNIIPLLESWETDAPQPISTLRIVTLGSDVPPADQHKFFKAILCYIDSKRQRLVEMGAQPQAMNSVRKLFIYQFLWKHLSGFNAAVPKAGSQFGQKDITQLQSLNRFLIECGVSKNDRVDVLLALPKIYPGKGNGVIGNFCKSWSSGGRKGMAWWANKDDFENRPKHCNDKLPIPIPWIGHLVCLACLYPKEPDDKFAVSKLEKNNGNTM